MSDADDFFDKLTDDDDDTGDPGADDNNTGDDNNDGNDGADNNQDGNDDSILNQKSLEEQLAEANKQIAGLKSATVKYRQGQADLKKQLDELGQRKSTLEQIIEEGLEKRKARQQDGGKQNDDPYAELQNLNAEVDKDGNVVVPADKLVEILRAQDKKLDDVKAGMTQKEKVQKAKDAYHQHVQGILGENESYPKAYDTLKQAASGLEKQLQIKLKQRNLDPKTRVTPGQALDLLSGSDELKAFQKEFPMVDADILVRAFDSDWDFKRALDQCIDRNFGQKDETKDDVFSKVKAKPSNFQSTSNQKKEVGGLLDRAARLGPDDLMDLSDADAERLERQMKKESEEADL